MNAPLTKRERWTDWITMVLKNCGAWQTSIRAKIKAAEGRDK